MVVDWINANVLTEEVVIATLHTIRERLAERLKAANSDLPQLRSEAERLRAEIDRLVAAIAAGSSTPQALVNAVAERQEQLSAVDARLRAAQAAPEAISLEVRRLEQEVRRRIAELREALGANPEQARGVMQSLFPGPLTCTPTDTPDGKRFLVEGTAAVGRVLLTEPVSNVASPRGFEPLLQP